MAKTSPDSRGAEFLDQAYAAIHLRFPLLQLLEFANVPDNGTGRFPNFVGLIAGILESSDKPCCVVLPDYKDVAIAVSTLSAVTRLRDEFPGMLRTHASTTFREREDHVLVHPCGLVYRYDGFFNPTMFKLKVIDRNESRSLPVTEIARLEKTNHKRPKGQLNSDLGQSQPTVMGSILGIKTAINRNLLRNHVLVLGARKHFLEALDRWTIQTTTLGGPLKRMLKDEVSFGKVTEGGSLCFLDDYVAAGEPLVAIASRAEDLAAHCVSAGKFEKLVLVEEIDYLTRDWRAYDSITETQHTVILANDSQRESVLQLEERGCEVWRLSSDEILFGLPEDKKHIPLREAVAKASNARNLIISGLPCKEESLDRAASELKVAADSVDTSDSGAIRELLYSLFRTLMFCAEYLGQDSTRFASTAHKLLALARGNLDRARVWLTPDAGARISQALDDMQVAVARLSETDITPKGTVLLETLRVTASAENRAAVLIVRGDTTPDEMRQWLNESGIQVGVYPLNSLPENEKFDRILVVSWPRSAKFDRLVHQYSADHLGLLAYPFEENWLDQYSKGYQRSISRGISRKRKMQLLGLPSSDCLNEASESESPQSKEGFIKFDLPAERFLTRRKIGRADQAGANEELHEEMFDAFYVDFAGPTFAYLSDGHELPVLNAYISGQQASPGKVPLRSVDDLKEGDYVMFRESGDSDIIRFLAEDEIGKDKYQQLRITAGRWRVALQNLGSDPRQVLERLKPFGFSRHLQTVRGWLTDQNTICPQDITDVRKIAGAAHDKELFISLPELERARDELMSSHISAGFRLTELLLKELPKKIGLLGQGETEIDLGVGKVWVVRIEEIDRSPSLQRRSQVNRLLWDAGVV